MNRLDLNRRWNQLRSDLGALLRVVFPSWRPRLPGTLFSTLLGLLRWPLIAVGLVLAWSLAIGAFTVRIEPGEVGVRLAPLGAGIEPRDHSPGRHLTAPGLWNWIRVDTATRFAWFRSITGNALDIRTADDNPATVDLVVVYRVQPGRAHELVREGRHGQIATRLQSTAKDILRSELAQLTSEQWFDTDQRRARVEAARAALREACVTDLFEVRDLRIHDISFTTEFETKLGQKQLAYQEKRREEARAESKLAEAALAEQKAAVAREAALIRARAAKARSERLAAHEGTLAQIQSRTTTQSSAIRGAADAELARSKAAGEEQIAAVRAEGERERLAALAEPGGEAWLAVRAARALQLKEVVLDPQLVSEELREWTAQFLALR